MIFGAKSKREMATLHPDWLKILNRVKQRCTERDLDFSVNEGHRNKARQDLAVEERRSFAVFPNSAHNKKPSPAVDLLPHPVRWTHHSDFFQIAAIVLNEAHVLGIRVKWGGLFKRRGNKLFFDGPHFQLIAPRRL
jgi:peptidoglycan L-alanyl-D-glutamate endopeptidase CwlK